MAMKKCKECGEEISSSAKKCPKCGKDQRNFFMKHPVLYTILILIVIAVASSSGSSDTGSATTPMTGTTTSTVQEDFTLQDGHTGSSDEYGMSYTIEGSIKNNTNKQYSYVQVTFNLCDADGAQIGSALANINNLEANGLWEFKALGSLGDGKSVASYKLMEITGW